MVLRFKGDRECHLITKYCTAPGNVVNQILSVYISLATPFLDSQAFHAVPILEIKKRGASSAASPE